MDIIKGDILENLDSSKDTIILHGCNCHHVMGAGIAAYLRKKYPKIYAVDMTTPYADRDKLGTFSVAVINPKLAILNCYTQFDTGRGRQVDYEAVYSVLESLSRLGPSGKEIRSPKIGCGLAGGDWDIVKVMFEKTLPSATIYNL